jgi:hypothetical protein
MGLSTSEEMCLAYVMYYPKLQDVSAEHCAYGNYTGIGYNTNQTVVCGATRVYNWSGPYEYEEYVPPVCVYNAPPTNDTTPRYVNSLNTSRYTSNMTLDQDGKYRLYWNVDRENLLFHAAVEVKTEGWVGMGISPGGMDGADVFIGWVKDGQVYFADRFATQKSLPPVDTRQDFYDISGGQYTTPDQQPATSEALLSKEAIIGVSVGGGLIFVGLFLIFFFHCRKKQQKDTLLTTDTYGGTTDNENLDPPSRNKRGQEPVPL